MDSIPCDIVILPTIDLASKAIAASRQLESHATLFTLQETTYVPHASLYMTQLKVADIEKVKELLREIAERTPLLELTTTGYGQAEGYIDADYKRTDELARLQAVVIEAINPIRDGMREKDKARMLTTEGKVRENLEKYGYRGVGELFRPHLTFTRFTDGQPIDTNALPDPHQFDGKFIKLGLFEMGDNGTCTRRVAEFDLTK